MVNNPSTHLGELFKSSRKKGAAGLPLLSVTLNNGLIVRDQLDRRTETNLEASEHLLVQIGDIAYNMMRVWQGALGRASANGLVSPAYVVLRPTAKIDSLYAEYLFKTPRMIYLFWAYSYGLTKDRLRLYFNDFSRIRVTVPDLKVQRKIAQILSTWDKAITTTEQLLANSQQQKKALMQQLLTGRKRLLDKNGVRFGEEWLTDTLKNIVGKIYGGGTPSRDNPDYWGGSIPWVTVKDLIRSRIDGAQECITDRGLKESSANTVPAGTVIISTRMAVGKTVVASVDVVINQDLKAISPSENVCSEYLFYWFTYHTQMIEKMGTGSTVKGVQIDAIKSLPMSVPSTLEEQQKIAAVLSTADQEISALQQKLDALKQEKKALMQQLLTGKRRVKVEEAA